VNKARRRQQPPLRKLHPPWDGRYGTRTNSCHKKQDYCREAKPQYLPPRLSAVNASVAVIPPRYTPTAPRSPFTTSPSTNPRQVVPGA